LDALYNATVSSLVKLSDLNLHLRSRLHGLFCCAVGTGSIWGL